MLFSIHGLDYVAMKNDISELIHYIIKVYYVISFLYSVLNRNKSCNYIVFFRLFKVIKNCFLRNLSIKKKIFEYSSLIFITDSPVLSKT